MTTRILPAAEWAQLAETDLATLLPYVERDDVQIVVVEDGDRIVGSWAVLRVIHLEGLWIHPDYRGRISVARRLLKTTFEVARRWTQRWVMTGAQSDDVRRMLTKMGAQQIPMDTYVMAIGERECR